MLAIFKKGLADPPTELNSAASMQDSAKPKQPEEALECFLSSHPDNAFSIAFGNKASMAFAPPQPQYPQHRSFCGVDDIYCIFMGSLSNLSTLNKQYGLKKGSNDPVFVIEAYRTLRDRGPYPAYQVLQDLEGSFGFVLYDIKTGIVFVSLGGDGGVKLFWGIATDGSMVISDSLQDIKATCSKSFAPFPHGCMYHSEVGLMSYEHPSNKMKAMTRIDSEGIMCGAIFKVDAYSRTKSMPRVGSQADWTVWGQEA